jgi:glyoxylase-like metal-dependent hydrolase (beta-lactamase superfamily II)
MSMLRIELVTTDGVFSLDGEDFDVTNNVWLVGDEDEVVVIDAAHHSEPILDAVGGRKLVTIACTHGHNDHINAAQAVAVATDAPVLLHPEDRMLWDVVYPDWSPAADLADGGSVAVGGGRMSVLHTPGHSPGCCCFLLEGRFIGQAHDNVFSGDTLFCGGPGATGRSFSDPDLILRSIQRRLLTLPASTVVHTGHGDSTTVGAEAPLIEELLASLP